LRDRFAALGVDLVLRTVPTYPTGSIRRRTARLLEVISQTPGAAQGNIHLIGHSTGGLDARLLTSPNASLDTDLDVGMYASRVRSVITVCTPHFGTPLASFFGTLFGSQLLRLLSLGTVYTLRFGHLPLSAVLKVGAMVARLDSWIGLKHNVADQLYEQLLGDFSAERRRAVENFMRELGNDRALLQQLMPEGADMANAGIANRTDVRYGSVVVAAPRPGPRTVLRVGLDPYGQATHAIFTTMHRMTSQMPQRYLPMMASEQHAALRRGLPFAPTAGDSDGVVPTFSQVWGDVVHACQADHHDVIGHFGDGQHDPPHYDWLSSGSGFDRRSFERLWTDVTHYIVRC